MQTALVIIHVIIALVLTTIVLMQHGKQQGLSGAIAGGAETFFGKNKGRTIDAMLKKITAVFAILFIVSSIVLTYVSISQASASAEAEAAQTTDAGTEGAINVTQDENGNLVDSEGNIVMSAEDIAAQQADQAAEGTDAAEADGAAGDAAADTAEGAAEDAAADTAEGADAGAADDAAAAE